MKKLKVQANSHLPGIIPMKENYATIPITDIYLDESIYPRENIDHKRIKMFVENLSVDGQINVIDLLSKKGFEIQGKYSSKNGFYGFFDFTLWLVKVSTGCREEHTYSGE
jgi:hypothetical protein